MSNLSCRKAIFCGDCGHNRRFCGMFRRKMAHLRQNMRQAARKIVRGERGVRRKKLLMLVFRPKMAGRDHRFREQIAGAAARFGEQHRPDQPIIFFQFSRQIAPDAENRIP